LQRICVCRLQFVNSSRKCRNYSSSHRLKYLHPTYAQEGVSNDHQAAKQVRINKNQKQERTSVESSICSDSGSHSCSLLRRAARCARIMLMASSSPLEGSVSRTRFRFFGLTAKPGTCLMDQSNLCTIGFKDILVTTYFLHHANVSVTHGSLGSVSNKSTMLLKNASLSK
jgi:ubiquitin C-terminal hydrolase